MSKPSTQSHVGFHVKCAFCCYKNQNASTYSSGSQFKIEWKFTLTVLALIHANRQTWQGKLAHVCIFLL